MPNPSKKKSKKKRSIADIIRYVKNKTGADVQALMKELKLDFINWDSRSDRVTQLEDRFLHKALNDINCEHEILDVYGDGNCLFYGLLFLLRMKEMTLSNSKTIKTPQGICQQ